jgi:hypothetical protein
LKRDITMKKRPTIKGRGADIYLGGNSKQHPDQRPKKARGNLVAEEARTENGLNALNANGESACGLDGLRQTVAWHIATAEKLANQTIEQQERRVEWAKDAPLAPWFDAQAALARKIVAQSAAAARSLWRIRY